VIDEVDSLYDYDVVRRLREPTMLMVHVSEPVLVLGSSQSTAVLGPSTLPPLRRRRGGGGVVLLQPDDLWVDWWIPVDDPRYRTDLREASGLVGGWWQRVLLDAGVSSAELYLGSAEVPTTLATACFAGRGPGEVFVEGRKAVGLTQWRVREGSFISTVLPAHSMAGLVDWLRDPSEELRSALDHCVVGEWDLDPDDLIDALGNVSSPVRQRQLFLLS
jgi:lipoate-protein ligase A